MGHLYLSQIEFNDLNEEEKNEYMCEKINVYKDEDLEGEKIGWKPIQGPKLYQWEIEWLVDVSDEIKATFSLEEQKMFTDTEEKLGSLKEFLKRMHGSGMTYRSNTYLDIEVLEWLLSNN